MNIIEKIKELTGNSPDLIVKELKISNQKINLIFFETLCDTANIDNFLLKYLSYLKINNKIISNLYKYTKEFTPSHNIKELSGIDDIINNIYFGFVVFISKNKYYGMEFKKKLDSGIVPAENEKTIKGPKDSFTENYQTNIGLIRKRLKTEKLWLEEVIVGTKSKTKIGIMYISDIVDLKMVNDVKEKIKNINIDSIPDSNYIYELIKNSKSLFPSVLSTERPDLIDYKLTNGKIAIIVENTPFVLLLPVFFTEFFHTMDDYYQNNKNTTYMRIVRLIAFVITIMLPAVYIALITYNHEIIPPELLVNFAIQKEGVPFPTIIEALILSITFEILRETDVRTPSTLGSALSIVGALVLGDAAVQAGLVSPIMVIVIAITAISEMIFSITEIANAVKIWRLLFIVLASVSGMIGVFISIILLVAELSSINSFGFPYLYPSAPLDLHDQNNNIILTEKYKLKFRNKLTAKKNMVRSDI